MVVRSEEIATEMKIDMNGEIMEVMNLLMYFCSCFSRDGEPQDDVEIEVGEGIKKFGAMTLMFIVASSGLSVKRKAYERVVVPTIRYGSDTSGMGMDERRNLDIAKM